MRGLVLLEKQHVHRYKTGYYICKSCIVSEALVHQWVVNSLLKSL